jgi:energy-coupling factor transport system ATP-binding protein
LRLELKGVRLTYGGEPHVQTEALAGVSLRVEPGERLAIAGPIGSGKSTLLSVMAGITAPDAGEVLHDGVRIGPKRPPRRGSIGLAFQSPEDCLFAGTVLDDVAFGLRHAGLSEAEVKARAARALRSMGLDDARFGSRNPFSLSAGEKRRAALAGVTVLEPELLLLDEPAAFLDPASRADLAARLIALNEEHGMTLVVVSHDMEEISRLAQRIVIMHAGIVAADAEAGAILRDEELLLSHDLRQPDLMRLAGMLERAGQGGPPLKDEQAAADRLLALARRGTPDG